MPDLALAPCPSYAPEDCRAALEQVIAATDGLSWVKPGMRVGIKANLVAAKKPDAAATTHPALLEALCRMLRDRGAVPVIGDSPGGLYTALALNRVYRAAGMDTVDAELNADFGVREVTLPEAKIVTTYGGRVEFVPLVEGRSTTNVIERIRSGA